MYGEDIGVLFYSELEWRQCSTFQEITSGLLRAGGFTGNITDIGRNTFKLPGKSVLHPPIIDLATNTTGDDLSTAAPLVNN